MAQQKTFFERIGHHGLCVILADALVAEPEDTNDSSSLHAVARDGLCFASLTTIRSLGGEDYLVRVGTTPDLVETYTVLFTEDQLRFCLPWDARLEKKSSQSIRAAICAHAHSIQPVQALPQEPGHFLDILRDQPLGEIAAEAGAFEGSALRLADDTSEVIIPTPLADKKPLLDLPVSAQDVQEAIKLCSTHRIMPDARNPRVRAFLQTVHLDIALKALGAWIEKLMDHWQEGFVDTINYLHDARECLKSFRAAFLVADTYSRQPVTRVSIQGLRRKGLSARAWGVFVIDKSVLPIAA